MHVAYLTTDFVDNFGPTTGLPKYLLKVALTLTKWGHKVTIITCSNRTVEYYFYNIYVIRVRRPNIVKCGDLFKDTIAECSRDGDILNKALREYLNYEKVDIIQYASLCGIANSHDFSIPAVMRMSSYACMWKIPGREAAQMAYAEMERKAALKCQGIFAPSNVVAKKFGEDIGRPVDVIETPFVMEDESYDCSVYEELLCNKRYILFFGTLIEYKGLLVIADAINEILDKWKDVFYVIIGNGDKTLIDQIIDKAGSYKNRIIYHEAINFIKLKPIIKNAEVVTLPSVMENFSNACVETMAIGNIVIGTKETSFEQLITDGVNGYLCLKDDKKTFLNKVSEALNLDSNKRENIIKCAKERAHDLVPEITVKKLLEYYTNIISGRYF